jgi:hypothetical protein
MRRSKGRFGSHNIHERADMFPVTLSYHLEETLKGTSLEGWADYVGLTAITVLLYVVRLLFFASRKQDISGKVALITGGGRGIGLLMAKKLALEHGCKVIFAEQSGAISISMLNSAFAGGALGSQSS